MKRKHAEHPEYQETLPEVLLRVIDPAKMTLDEVAGAVNGALHVRRLRSEDMTELLNAYVRITRRAAELAGKCAGTGKGVEALERLAEEKMIIDCGLIEAMDMINKGGA